MNVSVMIMNMHDNCNNVFYKKLSYPQEYQSENEKAKCT